MRAVQGRGELARVCLAANAAKNLYGYVVRSFIFVFCRNADTSGICMRCFVHAPFPPKQYSISAIPLLQVRYLGFTIRRGLCRAISFCETEECYLLRFR